MSTKKSKPVFDLETPYTLAQAAEILGKSPDWVKQNAVKTGELQFAPLGDSPVTTGRWILDFVQSRGTFYGEPNCPTTKRGKKGKSGSTPRGAVSNSG